MRYICLFIILAGLFGRPYSASADIYVYVDRNGVTHFTNAPVNPAYNLFSGTSIKRKSAYAGRYDYFIKTAAQRYGVNPMLVKAIIKVESDFNPQAVSVKGARGLMQLMPSVAREMMVSSPYDPGANIHGGTRYMRKLLDLFAGDLDLALAAYNAGPTRVKKEGGVPKIKETRNFVKKVRSRYRQYQAADPGNRM